MKSFREIHGRAVAEKGGEEALRELLPQTKSAEELRATADDRYLAEMTKGVFRAGFVWRVVENKWDGFEAAFGAFDVTSCAMLSDEDLERLAEDERIIRNTKKIQSVRNNANFIREIREEHGTFGAFLAGWPDDDIVGLWDVLKKRGDRLGGNTGPMFLRFVGKDTFVLSDDVVKALIEAGIVEKKPSSKKALQATQEAFNQWHDETGLPRCQISRILAASVGEPAHV
jgi:3-methyladenine DNA glycosylase Tag